MENLLSTIKIQVNEKIYVKDPETSILGKKIIEKSILLIDEIGFEEFTFKKLGDLIGSNESSIYRYFENKHKLLIYLCSWYWSWMEYRLVFTTNNLTDPLEKLKKAIAMRRGSRAARLLPAGARCRAGSPRTDRSSPARRRSGP